MDPTPTGVAPGPTGSDSIPRAPARWIPLLALLAILTGLGFSVELTRIHLLVFTRPEFVPVCAVSEGVNCATVALSPWSVFAGLPVSAWGVGAYLLMGALTVWGGTSWRLHPAWPWGLLTALAGVATCVSITLWVLCATRIDSVCLYCMATYGVNFLLLGLALLAGRRSGVRIHRLLALDLKALVRRPALVASAVLLGVAVLVGAQVWVPSYWRTPGWSDLPRLPSGTDDAGRHWIGAKDPEVTVVEFSDYECPHCRAAHKAVRLLAAEYPDRVRLVHRHLPLDQSCHPRMRRPFHTRACHFAEAAECAALQGRFWEMNDALFSTQETHKARSVDPVDLAVRIGLDRSAFKRCLADREAASRVAEDLEDAVSLKLTATPTFVVGSRAYRGRIPEGTLQGLLDGTAH
ncbi:MAG: thioredoxin domain-containing protein [Deltaproteobacteria bacterium]|nr:thioredoxin domain-containing protein [Deltaproteobacteria bacterium]